MHRLGSIKLSYFLLIISVYRNWKLFFTNGSSTVFCNNSRGIALLEITKYSLVTMTVFNDNSCAFFVIFVS